MGKRIRKLFTDLEVESSINKAMRDDGSVSYNDMSSVLSHNDHGTTVSPELCRYWALQFKIKNKSGKTYKTLTKANESIRSNVKLREPSRYDDFCTVPQPESDNNSVLVIPDLHAPYHHPDTLDFLYAVSQAYDCDTVISLGDEADKHGLSFHDSDPNLDSAGMELEKTRKFLACLEQMFPYLRICHSNHGSLVYRRAASHGIPVQYLRTYREALFPDGQGQGWDWQYNHKLTLPNGSKVLFKHQPNGTPIATAAHEGINVVTGHLHGKLDVEYAASSERLYWGVSSGCLIDKDSLAFAYGKEFKLKPILGCTVIMDSLPHLVPMRLNGAGRWIGLL